MNERGSGGRILAGEVVSFSMTVDRPRNPQDSDSCGCNETGGYFQRTFFQSLNFFEWIDKVL
jgi:hypothetical protein